MAAAMFRVASVEDASACVKTFRLVRFDRKPVTPFAPGAHVVLTLKDVASGTQGSRAYTLTETLKPLRDLDWKTLMMLGGKNAEPKTMVALAFQQMAENAQKIGELNISPDLLRSLIGNTGK